MRLMRNKKYHKNILKIIVCFLIVLFVVSFRYMLGGNHTGVISLSEVIKAIPYISVLSVLIVVYIYYAKKNIVDIKTKKRRMLLGMKRIKL